jgi:hypothetical protein
MAARTSKPSTETKAIAVPQPGLPVALQFIGRVGEKALLRQLLTDHLVVVVRGAAGIGKSRLVDAVTREASIAHYTLRCLPDDTAEVLVARAERLLRCGWGNASTYLSENAALLVIDQGHVIAGFELARLISELAPAPTLPTSLTGTPSNTWERGRLVVTTRQAVTELHTSGFADVEILGLDAATGMELFDAMDAKLGPLAIDIEAGQLHLMTSGNPRAIIDMFTSQHTSGSEMQTLCSIVDHIRCGLDVAAIATIVASSSTLETAAQLAALGSLQQVAMSLSGSFHSRDSAVPASDISTHQKLSAIWGALVDRPGTGDPLDALREAVRHALYAQDLGRATTLLMNHRHLATHRGATAEFLALIAACQLRADETSTNLSADWIALWAQLLLAARYMHDVKQLAQRCRRHMDSGSGSPAMTISLLSCAVAMGDALQAQRLLLMLGDVAGSGLDHSQVVSLRLQADLLSNGGNAWRELRTLAELTADPQIDAVVLGQIILHQQGLSAAREQFGSAMAAAKQFPTQTSLLASCWFAQCLIHEGRLSAAGLMIDELHGQYRLAESVLAQDGYLSTFALLRRHTGGTGSAILTLKHLVQRQRHRGDEVLALHSEMALAEIELRRGHVIPATELVAVVKASAQRLGLGPLLARAELGLVQIDIFEYRPDAALVRLANISPSQLGKVYAAQYDIAYAKVMAQKGEHSATRERLLIIATHAQLDELTKLMASAEVMVTLGDLGDAREKLVAAAALAERHGNKNVMVLALALLARVYLARGDRNAARSCASRAAREASTSEYGYARCSALLALSALSRGEDDAASGMVYARDAADLASLIGLPVERFLAFAALDAIAGPDSRIDPTSPNAATLTPIALDACNKMLAEFGLSAQRPYGLIDAEGNQSEAVDASPEVLQLAKRALAVDGVRESIWRQGQELADLRRRSLLKKLLFLFASAPGVVFTKEAIVSAVWNVDYHPLRHDAALFTNIMRIRRLLGEGGSDIIRVTEDGYRFVPPSDFVFVFAR